MSDLLPLAAAGAPPELLLDLFFLLLGAKLGEELFKRLGQPGVIGEIAGGVVVGGSVLGLVEPGETIAVFAELGVIFLLFWVGLETKLSDMQEVGGDAIRVGLLGVLIPGAAGVGLGFALGDGTAEAIFLGVALVATSVGITSAVLLELGAIDSRAARTILGAAVIDDILALVALSIATSIAEGGGVSVIDVALSIGVAGAFVGFIALGGSRLLAARPGLLKTPRFSESPLLPAVIVCLGLAAIAAEIGLAAIIGAFLAGMVVAETKDQHPIEEEVAPLYAFLPPFFFAFIGTQLELGELADAGVLALVAAISVLAIVTKYVGAWLGARSLSREERRVVGIGMVPRGEVGIIVAGIGASEGVVGDERFAVIVAMALLTTIVAPVLLRRALAATAAPG